jgi:hypothetical protein
MVIVRRVCRERFLLLTLDNKGVSFIVGIRQYGPGIQT